jgi:hypothetical protein
VNALSNSQQYLTIKTLDHRILMNRRIALGHTLSRKSPFKVAINLFNGLLTLTLPPFLLDSAALGRAAVLRRIALLHRLIDETLIEARALLEWLLRKVPRNPESSFQPIKAK